MFCLCRFESILLQVGGIYTGRVHIAGLIHGKPKKRSTASRTTGIAPSSVTCSCKDSDCGSKPRSHAVGSTKEQLKFTSSQSARYMSTERLSPGVRLTILAVGIWRAEVALCHSVRPWDWNSRGPSELFPTQHWYRMWASHYGRTIRVIRM